MPGSYQAALQPHVAHSKPTDPQIQRGYAPLADETQHSQDDCELGEPDMTGDPMNYPTPANQNFPDDVLYEMDNLDVLRGMNSETVDLIATDPPFNKKRNRASTAGQYEDAWRWADHPSMAGKRPDQWLWQPVHREWLDEIKDARPALFQTIEATRSVHDDDTAAFLCFLSVRLLEMHRILKPTGSIYLHCDNTANSSIRSCMEAIFGIENFQNQIIWRRTTRGFKGSQFAPRRFNNDTDTILFFSKTNEYYFDMDPVRQPYDPDELEATFKLRDDTGPYYLDTMHNRPSASARPNLCYDYKGYRPPNPSGWKVGRDRMEALDRAGDLIFEEERIRRKIRPKPGTLRGTTWIDIGEARGRERTGSPDQKPLALYERIIMASSRPGDLVLDPFAGCATTPIAARNLGRRWIGIDRRTDARFHVVRRLMGIDAKTANRYAQRPDLSDWLDTQLAKFDAHYETKPPIRTDMGETAAGRLGPVYSVRRKTIFTHAEMKQMLIEQFGNRCWGCQFDSGIYGDRADLYLELDHVNPKKSGGHDELDNRALLCGPCNRLKSDTMTLGGLRRNVMAKAARDHPIDLTEAGNWSRSRLMKEIADNPQLAE